MMISCFVLSAQISHREKQELFILRNANLRGS